MAIIDEVVFGKIVSILGELGYYPDSYDVNDAGMHRLYSVRITVRDDEEISEDRIRAFLNVYNAVGIVKPQLYGIEDYPAELRNFSHLYLTFYI